MSELSDRQPLNDSPTEDLSPEQSGNTGGHLVSRVLSPAVKFWLRSQAEHIEQLDVVIGGRDRQLLSGYIPEVTLGAEHVIYQGLHLSQLRVMGRNIRINLGQMLRGKPFHLLEVVPVTIEVFLQTADLNASLQSALLKAGVADLLYQLLTAQHSLPLPTLPETPQSIELLASCLQLTVGRVALEATLKIADHDPITLVLQSGIDLVDGRKLCFTQPTLLDSFQDPQGQLIPELDGFCLDLGPEVNLETLSLDETGVTCYGCINVIP